VPLCTASLVAFLLQGIEHQLSDYIMSLSENFTETNGIER